MKSVSIVIDGKEKSNYKLWEKAIKNRNGVKLIMVPMVLGENEKSKKDQQLKNVLVLRPKNKF